MKIVYFDMDGVLVNFVDGFCGYFSDYTGQRTAVNVAKWDFYIDLGLTDDEFEGWVETLPECFWAELEPLEGFEKYVSDIRELQAKGYEVEILTHAASHAARTGKMKWLEANGLGDLTYHPVITASHKADFADKNSVLIDDNEDNILQFTKRGGEGMLVDQPWNGGYSAAEIMNSWLHCGGGVVSWVVMALGQAVEPEPMLDVKALIDIIGEEDEEAINVDSFGFPIKDENSYFELPKSWQSIETVIPDDVTPPPAGVLDYSTMNDKEYRKNTPVCSGFLWYFPDAIELVAQNSMVGWHQHCDTSKPMYWDRSKSADEPDAMVRHLIDHKRNPVDVDGTLHLSKVAWRALAMLQKYLEENPDWRKRNEQ